MKNSYLTIKDQFCGAGGSSLGARRAAQNLKLKFGIDLVLKMAVNHWKLAIETHQTNFPDSEHVCCNISHTDPRYFPSTDILITSPECTVHSPAGGGTSKKRMFGNQLALSGKLASEEAEERSRMTMWDVCNWTEYHRYNIVIVENVIEARTKWVLFDEWLKCMMKLGYEYKIKYINSMHAHPTPQSRDRMYCVFWKKGNKEPNLEFNPVAYCHKCAKNVEAFQWWKPRHKKSPLPAEHGKYRTQYLFRCPECNEVVEPYFFAAFNCIDWTKPGTRIGDRKRPLKEKTRQRCQYGIDKFWDEPSFINVRHSSGIDYRVKSVADSPLNAQTTDSNIGILNPVVVSGRYISGIGNRVKPSEGPLPVQVTEARESVLFPPGAIVSVNYDGIERRVKSTDDPLPSQTAQEERALLTPPIILDNIQGQEQMSDGLKNPMSTQTTGQTKAIVMPFLIKNFGGPPQSPIVPGDALGAVTTQDHHAIVNPPLITELHGTGKARQSSDPLSTVEAGGNHHGLLNAPLIVENHGESKARPATERLGAITTKPKHGIITSESFNSFLSYYNGKPQASHITEEMKTISTVDRLYKIDQPYQRPRLDDCYYRMLLPHEIQLGMAFDQDYIVLGDSKQKVKQLGNAVTPPVMEFLIERCVESLQ